MLNLLKEYIHRVVNEEINNPQYPKHSYKNKQFRIPFSEYGYGDSWIDIYIDWIKAVSKKGTLPKPTVNFKEEVSKGIEKFHDNKHANRDIVYKNYKTARKYMSKDELQQFMKDKSTLFKDAKFKNGNLYVERQIGVTIDNMHQNDPSLFNDLTKSYNNTVGGCWAFREGKGEAYCSYDANFFITFKGYMFLDDIYWDELIRLETRPNMREYEVRTYPNGRVQLEEIHLHGLGEDITLSAKDFDGPRIINSTYLGNNVTFNGNFAKLGYENIGYENQFIDRDGNEYKDVAQMVLKMLESGKEIEEIVDGKKDIGLRDGLYMVSIYNKCNFIDERGNLLHPNQWFDGVGLFCDGFAAIKLNDKWNYIDTEGNLLSPNQWFDGYDEFRDGVGRVRLNDNYNFIDSQGNILSPNQWFDSCWDFRDGVSLVKLNKKWNFIDKQGNILSPNQWFDWCDEFNKGYAKVLLDKQFNFIDKQGNIVSPNLWFDDCRNYNREGFGEINLDNKWNWIDGQGNVLSPNLWFDRCWDFSEDVAIVKLNNEKNFIDTQGNLLSPNQWFNECGDFYDGFAIVSLNGKLNLINKGGNILSPNQWFDECELFDRDGFARVRLNGKENRIDKNGNLVSPNQWFDACTIFFGNFADVRLDKKWYKIDRDGNFYDEKTKQPIPNPIQKNENFMRRRSNQQLMEARFKNYLNELVKEMIVS